MGANRFLQCLFPPKGRLHFIYAKLDTAKVASYLWSLQCIPQNACMQFKKNALEVWNSAPLYSLYGHLICCYYCQQQYAHFVYNCWSLPHGLLHIHIVFPILYAQPRGKMFFLTDVFVFVGNSYDRLSVLPVNISLLLYLLLNLKLWT